VSAGEGAPAVQRTAGAPDPGAVATARTSAGGLPSTAPWISVVPYEEASGDLRSAYDWQAARLGAPTEFTVLGSLHAPLVLERLRLYKTVESVPSRLSPKERAFAAFVTSTLNRTAYCASGARLKLLHAGLDGSALNGLVRDLEATRLGVAAGGSLGAALPSTGDGRLDAIASYAIRLTLNPGGVTADDVDSLRRAGLDDLDILDVNNVVAYYNYVNRVANGLGLRHPIDDPAEALRAVPD
jgi:alkylhydroperoxidase family enzyme